MIAFGAYKMSKRHADPIEEHTGNSADELSVQELEQAMADLNIEKQPLVDSDNEYIDHVKSKEDKAESSSGASYLDELERLSQLHDEGVISEYEFRAKKKQLLGI